jgi:hypothetical protein
VLTVKVNALRAQLQKLDEYMSLLARIAWVNLIPLMGKHFTSVA